ncbi:MAG: DUF427 domain-containing protein [Myxococcales bacterium]|nr:DUF427 domain-containing protein [Myxococcales bacterium]
MAPSRQRSRIHDFPDYEVVLEANPEFARASLDDEVIAASAQSVIVRETRHAPVIYFPREDVRWERLEATDHTSFCPFKGDASYWTVRGAERVEENAVWGYADPFPEVAELANYVAFYGDRIRVESAASPPAEPGSSPKT